MHDNSSPPDLAKLDLPSGSLSTPISNEPAALPGFNQLNNIPCCPVCGGGLEEIRAKYQCRKCHRICETCCEGGRG